MWGRAGHRPTPCRVGLAVLQRRPSPHTGHAQAPRAWHQNTTRRLSIAATCSSRRGRQPQRRRQQQWRRRWREQQWRRRRQLWHCWRQLVCRRRGPVQPTSTRHAHGVTVGKHRTGALTASSSQSVSAGCPHPALQFACACDWTASPLLPACRCAEVDEDPMGPGWLDVSGHALLTTRERSMLSVTQVWS